MTKKIVNILIFISFLIIIFSIYLINFGIETKRFNSLIKNEVKNQNNRIDIDLKKVKLHLDLKNFSLKIKTQDPVLIIDKEMKILIKEISSNISIASYFKNKFLLNNINILTHDNKLKKYLALYLVFERTPQIILLNQIIKNGKLKFEVNINFDENGKIKNNYKIIGEAKNIDFRILKYQNIKSLNFDFDIKENIYDFIGASVNFNDINFKSNKISVLKEKKNLLVKGSLNSKTQKLNENFIKLITDLNFKNLELIDKKFSTNTDFSFRINNKFKISELNYNSKVKIDELKLHYKNQLLKKIFKDYKKSIRIRNNKFLINYSNNKLNLKGESEYSIKDNNIDLFNFEIAKEKNKYNYDIFIDLTNQHIEIYELDYLKKVKSKSFLKIKGQLKKNKIDVNNILFKEGKNSVNLKNLIIQNNKILNIGKVEIDLPTESKFRNNFKLIKKNKNYSIEGQSLNFEKLISNMSENKPKINFLKIFDNLNSKINININLARLDNESNIEDLNGTLEIKNNKIFNANFKSSFSDNEKIFLRINTNEDNSVTTNFSSDRAKPFVKKYKFIKGFDGGNIDFSSSRKGDVTKSKLIIDNFKIQEVPILAKLLTLASLQGIADLLTGEGIRFTDFEMLYSKKGNLTTIDEIYSIGPAISIMMEGYIEEKKLVSLRGTLVPARTINRTISSIPLIGDILVGKKVGEGVFGVSFKIKGHPRNLKTSVNPVKTLTPRFITRTLEKIKKN